MIADAAPVVHGVEAWAQTVNGAGGLAGRMVRVDGHVVGSPAVYAGGGRQRLHDRLRDRRLELRGTTARAAGWRAACRSSPPACSTPRDKTRANSFALFPAQPGLIQVGAFKHLLAATSGCCRQYVLVPTVEPGRGIVQQSVQGAAAVGFTTAGTPDVPRAPAQPSTARW